MVARKVRDQEQPFCHFSRYGMHSDYIVRAWSEPEKVIRGTRLAIETIGMIVIVIPDTPTLHKRFVSGIHAIFRARRARRRRRGDRRPDAYREFLGSHDNV